MRPPTSLMGRPSILQRTTSGIRSLRCVFRLPAGIEPTSATAGFRRWYRVHKPSEFLLPNLGSGCPRSPAFGSCHQTDTSPRHPAPHEKSLECLPPKPLGVQPRKASRAPDRGALEPVGAALQLALSGAIPKRAA